MEITIAVECGVKRWFNLHANNPALDACRDFIFANNLVNLLPDSRAELFEIGPTNAPVPK